MNIEDFSNPPARELNLDEAFTQIGTVDQNALRVSLANLSYQDFLTTTYWRCVAKNVKDRDGNHCKVCNGRQQLCAHHRHYMPRGTEHLNLADLTTLCDPCHQIFHENGRVDGTRLLKKKPQQKRQPKPKRSRSEKLLHRLERRRLRQEKRHAEQLKNEERNKNGPPPFPFSVDPIVDGVVLTWELIESCKRNGTFTAATINALGVVNMQRGWAKRLVGLTVSKENYAAAVAGKDILKTRVEFRKWQK